MESKKCGQKNLFERIFLTLVPAPLPLAEAWKQGPRLLIKQLRFKLESADSPPYSRRHLNHKPENVCNA